MQVKIKYWLFSFLIVFAAMPVAATVPAVDHVVHAVQKEQSLPVVKLQQPATGKALQVNDNYNLTDVLISNSPVSQSNISLTGRRVQTGKDLLLLHAAEYSNTVKTASCKQSRSADSLTHIFLFLFPYHFFW